MSKGISIVLLFFKGYKTMGHHHELEMLYISFFFQAFNVLMAQFAPRITSSLHHAIGVASENARQKICF
jgi:hypothetical protein